MEAFTCLELLDLVENLFLFGCLITRCFDSCSSIHNIFLRFFIHLGEVILNPVIMISLEQVSQGNEIAASSALVSATHRLSLFRGFKLVNIQLRLDVSVVIMVLKFSLRRFFNETFFLSLLVKNRICCLIWILLYLCDEFHKTLSVIQSLLGIYKTSLDFAFGHYALN